MPGTVLLREWGEREHRVTVTPTASTSSRARRFKSLSAVARHITGTHWSGPLFFGLRGQGRRPMNAPCLVQPKRCAVYCRVSTDERLDQ